MNGLKYTLVLEEPVLANSLAGDTNSARSLPYIPGGLVRGAIINAYANGTEIDAGIHPDFERLFLTGKTRFLPAYPELNGRRSHPAPLAWKVKKHAGGKNDTLENFAVQIKEAIDLKTVSFDLWTLHENQVHSLDQEWNINVHTQRDAEYGRAMGRMAGEDEARGAVFRYEALPADLRLHGLIFTSDAKDEKTLLDLLTGRSIMLGKARTAGYGHARIENVEPITASWRKEYWPWAPPTGEVNSFTLTFLSPAILRDPNGQFTLDPTTALKARGIEAKAEKVFRSAEIVGGFNRTWGMPLPQCWAISMGSVFVFTTATTGKALRDLEEQGLGERLAEGFGCVAVDAHQPANTTWQKVAVKSKKLQPATGKSSTTITVGNLMLKRLLRRNLDVKVLAFVASATREYKGGLTGSQLSRWRVIVRSVLGSNDPEKMKRLTDLFTIEYERASASWKKMERVRIHTEEKPSRLTEWLGAMLMDNDQPWLALGYTNGNSPVQIAGTLSFTADDHLRFEYRLRVIDAVFAALAKKSPKPQTEKEAQNG